MQKKKSREKKITQKVSYVPVPLALCLKGCVHFTAEGLQKPIDYNHLFDTALADNRKALQIVMLRIAPLYSLV